MGSFDDCNSITSGNQSIDANKFTEQMQEK